MPTPFDSLTHKRHLILQQMQAIDRLRRGTLSQQFFKPLDGHTKPRGPYFVLQGFFQGKKFSERVPSDQAPQVQEQVDNYRRFQSLAEEYVTLSDEITRLESQADSGAKKNSSRRRWRAGSSRRPGPSSG